jgi:hypothetical protein
MAVPPRWDFQGLECRRKRAREPAHVTKYALQLAQTFNNFYHLYHSRGESGEEGVPVVDDRLLSAAVGVDAGYSGHPGAGLYVISRCFLRLTGVGSASYTNCMEVHFQADLEAKLDQLSVETGRAKDELVQDAMAGYFDELARVRGMLDRRYDDIESGRVKPVGGEEFFEHLRQREEALLDKQHAPR